MSCCILQAIASIKKWRTAAGYHHKHQTCVKIQCCQRVSRILWRISIISHIKLYRLATLSSLKLVYRVSYKNIKLHCLLLIQRIRWTGWRMIPFQSIFASSECTKSYRKTRVWVWMYLLNLFHKCKQCCFSWERSLQIVQGSKIYENILHKQYKGRKWHERYL